MAIEYTLEPPYTCAYCSEPGPGKLGIYIDTPGSIIGAPDTYTDFQQFTSQEDCYAAVLLDDPTCPKNFVYGPIPIDCDLSDITNLKAEPNTEVTLTVNATCSADPTAVFKYTWLKLWPETPVGAETNSFTFTTPAEYNSPVEYRCRVEITGEHSWTASYNYTFIITK